MASSPGRLREARELLRDRYAWRGYRCGVEEELPHREQYTLVAEQCGKTLGTLTLGIDGPGGLLAEHSYREVIDEARRAGAVMCELTRFAVAPMTDCRAVMAPLLTSAYRLAKHEHEATDVFIEVNPRHVAFYRRGFGFAVAAGERFCHRARAPSVLLRLELAHLQERLQMLERAAAAS